MATTYMLLIFTLLSSHKAYILRLPECGKYDAMWTVLYQDQKLIKSIHAIVPNMTLHECVKMCMLHVKCKSISVHSEEKQCMIHHSRKGENGTRLEYSNGWVHMETNPDVQNPCGGAKCVDNCDKNKYTCSCTKETSWIMQSEGVCFSGKDNIYGRFAVSQHGVLVKLKLSNLGNSTLRCTTNSYATNWGCDLRPKNIGVVITDNNNRIIIPDKSLVNSIGEFSLAGFHANSDYIVFGNYSQRVKKAQKIRVWYGQDLLDSRHENNFGISCALVYAKFCK